MSTSLFTIYPRVRDSELFFSNTCSNLLGCFSFAVDEEVSVDLTSSTSIVIFSSGLAYSLYFFLKKGSFEALGESAG